MRLHPNCQATFWPLIDKCLELAFETQTNTAYTYDCHYIIIWWLRGCELVSWNFSHCQVIEMAEKKCIKEYKMFLFCLGFLFL